MTRYYCDKAGGDDDERSQPCNPLNRTGIGRTQRELIDEREAIADSAFQSRRVSYLATKLGLGDAKRRAHKIAFESSGNYYLTYDVLLSLVPSLPVLLGFARLGKLHLDPSATLPSLFNRFEKSPISRRYLAFYDEAVDRADGRAVGLVFPRNRVVHGLVVHNGDLASYADGRAAFVFRARRVGDVVVQRFADFVDALYSNRHEWH